jgi:hypothetical protein
MKFITLCSALYLISCSSQTQKNLESQIAFPIDSIIEITKEPLDIVKIQDFDHEKLSKIDSSFFRRYLEGLLIEGTDTMKLRFDYQPFWYFVDHRDLGNKIMFSILSDNESGYSVLYYLLYEKSSKSILSVNALGTYEGDGGYYAIDSLVWTSNKFISYSISGELEDYNDTFSIQSKDSSCIEYTLSNKKFIPRTIYTYSRKDTTDNRGNNN